ncbi:MAG: nicotinate-nucleotide adenylyltransferase [Bryobacteraceae bacterium]|nr:nicotinate-nucleotide adenylyltransferase [Bryobacteraceae bacterium]
MKTAIFGGTFDPVHSAHLTVAREAADRFHLDRVLFIPAAHPPHKRDTHTAYEHRYRMVELACQADRRFEPSRLEEGQQQSYSYYTIERVKQTLAPGDRLFFLIGADAFAEIDTWHRSAEVLDAVEFIVVTRPGHHYHAPEGARLHRLETLALPVSSSEIRQKLSAGRRAGELPEPVQEYIREHRLYL